MLSHPDFQKVINHWAQLGSSCVGYAFVFGTKDGATYILGFDKPVDGSILTHAWVFVPYQTVPTKAESLTIDYFLSKDKYIKANYAWYFSLKVKINKLIRTPKNGVSDVLPLFVSQAQFDYFCDLYQDYKVIDERLYTA